MKTGEIDAGYFHRKFDVDVLEHFAVPLGELAEQGMIALRSDGFDLTSTGLLQVDSLLPAFYDAEYQNARYT